MNEEIICTIYGEDGHQEDIEGEQMDVKGECFVDHYDCKCGVHIENVYYVEKVGTRTVTEDYKQTHEDWR